jgi:6-phosphogluconolactonase (cycloisomerase 2 family)
MIPRQFTINKAGTLLAAGLQQDGRVVVMKRDPATGALGPIIANAPVEGQVTCVVFDE